MDRSPGSRLRRSSGNSRLDVAAKTLIVYISTVSVVSALTTRDLVSAQTLAASPAKVATGHIWLLLTSGLTVDRPVVASLVSLVAFAAVAAAVAGPRIALLAGGAGHVLSAVIAYALLAALSLGQPLQFGGELARPDYGVSAVCAAWLGAAAGTLWLRRPTVGARVAVVAGCAAVTTTAYRLHPGLSVIASEHVFAFCIGLFVAVPELRRRSADLLRRRLVEPWRRTALDPVVGLVGTGALLVAAIAVAPTALATADAVASGRPASVQRCIDSWNSSWFAPRTRVGQSRPAFALVRRVPRIEKGRTYHDCSLAFYGTASTLSVHGRWSHGRVSAWHVRLVARPPVPPANARVLNVDGVRLQAVETGPHR